MLLKEGGGFNHRFNLSDEILIKDNHHQRRKKILNIIKKLLNQKRQSQLK